MFRRPPPSVPRNQVARTARGPGRWAARLALVAGLVAVAPAEAGENRLRVVTLNLLHGGPWSAFTGDTSAFRSRLEMVTAELRALDPDVVGLQEAAWARGRGDAAERLAGALGHHLAWASATERVIPPRALGWLLVRMLGFSEGPAILSRFPIVAREIHDLPRCHRRLDPRVLLGAVLETPAGRLRVYSTHTSRGDDCQVRRVGELVSARRDSVPSILMGDFNAVEESPALRSLVAGAGLVDAFRAANPEAAGPTVWQRIDAPVPTVGRRVDYIFLVPGHEVPGRVLESRLVVNTPARRPDGTPLWPSDHYGVLAEIGW
jgi:endonuclease/exonuclease/phosphatase family metal-dependent hydrolase